MNQREIRNAFIKFILWRQVHCFPLLLSLYVEEYALLIIELLLLHLGSAASVMNNPKKNRFESLQKISKLGQGDC